MKIHLVTFPDFDQSLLAEISAFFSGSNSPIQVESHIIDFFKMNLNGTDIPHEFFVLSDVFRVNNTVSEDDYVVSLSQNIDKWLNWGRQCQHKNVRIISNQPDKHEKDFSEKLYFVYEIIYLILQESQHELNSLAFFRHNEDCIHRDWDSSAFRYKTFKDDICPDCWKKSLKTFSESELFFLRSLLTQIKKQTSWKPTLSNNAIPAIEQKSLIFFNYNIDFGNDWDSIINHYRTFRDEICSVNGQKSLQTISEKELLHLRSLLIEIKKQNPSEFNLSDDNMPAIVLNKAEMKIKIEGDDGIEIKLSPLLKTLYIFFLLNNEGVTRVRFFRCRDEFEKIYKNVNRSRENEVLKKTLDKLFNMNNSSFDDKKGKLNKRLQELFNQAIATNYGIICQDGVFKVNLPEDKIKIIG